MSTEDNAPQPWLDVIRWPGPDDHKYRRGHCVVVTGGMDHAGAGRLAAHAAARAGAGLVTMACPADAISAYLHPPHAPLRRSLHGMDDYRQLLDDERITAVLLGPGGGTGDPLKAKIRIARELGKPCVLDADALTVFADNPAELFSLLDERCILTPHGGEFARLFPDIDASDRDKIQKTKEAAARAGCVAVNKGRETVIASPDGRCAINRNAPPFLATAGTGDVLAGICAGLLATGMPPYESACAAAWMHGEAANIAGIGLIADDLPEHLPEVWKQLQGMVA